MERNISYAIAAIKRLDNYRTGIERFDTWIEYAISDWHKFIIERFEVAA